jgi:transcriptional regulator with XRE-family HTH domain
MSRKPLHEAIKEAFMGQGLTQAQLAERLGVDQTTVSRLANGRWGDQGGPAPEVLARIEEAAGRPRGWILIQAGYVDGVRTPLEAFEVDPALTDGARRTLRDFYQGVVKSLEHARSGSDQA